MNNNQQPQLNGVYLHPAIQAHHAVPVVYVPQQSFVSQPQLSQQQIVNYLVSLDYRLISCIEAQNRQAHQIARQASEIAFLQQTLQHVSARNDLLADALIAFLQRQEQ